MSRILDMHGDKLKVSSTQPPSNEPTVIETVLPVASIEALEAMHEVNAGSIELDRTALDIESAENVMFSLEAIAVQAEAALVNGGFDKHGASMMDVAVESQLTVLGVENELVPSVEAFEEGSEEATRVSVESIKEAAKKLGKWIMDQYRKISAMVNKWFKRILDFFTKRKTKDLPELKDFKKPFDVTIGQATAKHFLNNEGKFDFKNVVEYSGDWAKRVDELNTHFDNWKEYNEALTKYFVDVAKAGNYDNAELPTLKETWPKGFTFGGQFSLVPGKRPDNEDPMYYREALPIIHKANIDSKVVDLKTTFEVVSMPHVDELFKNLVKIEEQVNAIGDSWVQKYLTKEPVMLGQLAESLDGVADLETPNDQRSLNSVALALAVTSIRKPTIQILNTALQKYNAGFDIIDAITKANPN